MLITESQIKMKADADFFSRQKVRKEVQMEDLHIFYTIIVWHFDLSMFYYIKVSNKWGSSKKDRFCDVYLFSMLTIDPSWWQLINKMAAIDRNIVYLSIYSDGFL